MIHRFTFWGNVANFFEICWGYLASDMFIETP